MFGLLPGCCVDEVKTKKKPPGGGPAVFEDSLRLTSTYALASPTAGRCENQKYAKK
jgi:hypothetical protein